MRAAAILEKQHIYVFDLDSKPASCNVYPLLPHDNFKVLLPRQPGKKHASIVTDTPAWSLTLGRDALPQPLLSSPSYLTHNLIVFSKHQGSFHSYKKRDNFPAQDVESLCDKLGLQFQAVNFEATKGKKRARTGKSDPVGVCSLLCISKPCLMHSQKGWLIYDVKTYFDLSCGSSLP